MKYEKLENSVEKVAEMRNHTYVQREIPIMVSWWQKKSQGESQKQSPTQEILGEV